MFNVHRLSSKNISIRNLILLFFTIVFGFASVITLAQISIPSSINNAWQTIGRITITSDGTDGPALIDMSSGGIYINSDIIDEKQNFSGKVLGIDSNGYLIYVYSQNLVISGGGGVGGDVYRTGNGSDIWNMNTGGGVGIGTENLSGKLHITSSNQTELYLEETNSGSAANINFENPTRIRALGGDSDPDVFYIGEAGGAIDFAITPSGNIGIGTFTPNKQVQVVGSGAMGGRVYIDANTVMGIHGSMRSAEININENPSVNPNGGLRISRGGNNGTIGVIANLDDSLYLAAGTSIPSMYLISGGNVGIGTYPTVKLDVAGTGSFQGICLNNDCRSAWPSGGAGGGDLRSTGTSNSIHYNLGNVGIGTATPTDNKLQIAGNITSSGFIARGNGVTASGYASTAMGSNTHANDYYTTTMGLDTQANGNTATAMGDGTFANGDASTAMGSVTHANGNFSTAMGMYTIASGSSSTAMGWTTHAYGPTSIAMGYQTNALGDVSTSMGMQTNAVAQYSTAMGLGTWATGYTSTAMGQNTHAAGQYSTSMGSATYANGWYSTAMGSNTHANANSSTAMGNNNVGYADSLLEVGMGGFVTPGNAFTVRAVGGVKIGDSGVTCAGDKLGTIKFVGDNFYGCKSSGWVLLN